MTYPRANPRQKCAELPAVTGSARIVGGDAAWQQVLQRLPGDWEASARATGAFERRRLVRSPGDLLRLVLMYTLVDWPFRLVAAWACAHGLADLSDVAARRRIRGTLAWLRELISAQLAVGAVGVSGGVCVRLIDATTAQRPGSTGTDWRLHLSFDLGRACIRGVEVTDAHGGETLARHPTQADEISVADRGYAHRRGIGALLAQGGAIVVRMNWQNLPLRAPDGTPLDLIGWLRRVTANEPGDRRASSDTPQGTVAVRVVARRLSQDATDRARRRVRKEARKHGRTPDARTLEAAGFVILVTTLDAEGWPAEAVLALYRFRWQIEMHFKRLKGVLQLAHLRMQDEELAQVYLYGKILAALLIEGEQHGEPLLQGEWWEGVDRPVSPWRCLVWYAQSLKDAVRGHLDGETLHAALPRLGRYLRDAPRKRKQQAASARAFLATQLLSNSHATHALLPAA